MLMALFVYGIIGLCGYIWLTRGFFSALIHLVCTVAAGAIALSLWEPLGYLLLANSPDRGFFVFLRDSAWAIALGVPFIVVLVLLRLATNKLLIFNAQGDKVGDAVGGAVCGAASGVLTAGIFMLAIGMLRAPADALGYAPVSYSTQATARGAIETTPGLFTGATLRADKLTANFYGYLSRTTFRTAEPLARWHPDMAATVAANRMTYEGKSRNTLKKTDFRVNNWYTIGLKREDGSFDRSYMGKPIAPLLADQWNGPSQGAIELNGERITNGYVAGFQVQLLPTSREKVGSVLVGAGQVRLVVESLTDEDTLPLFPVATVTAMDVTNLEPGQEPAYARFRFDGNDVFLSSVGGASETLMTFEFAVPSGYRPIGLYVKGTRWDVPAGDPAKNMALPAERDADIVAKGGVFPAPTEAAAAIDPVVASNLMGFTIQSGSERGLTVFTDGGNNWVRDGEEAYRRDQVGGRNMAGVDRSLQIQRFEVSPDTVLVKVNVSANSPASILSEAALSADPSQPLLLVDTNGVTYTPVGYVYSDSERYKLRYTLGRPIRSLQELTQSGITLSTSRSDQKLELIFRVTFGARIRAFQIGGTPIYELPEPLALDTHQK